MLVFAPLSGLKTFISAFRVTLLGVLNVAATSQRQVSPARRWRGRARPAREGDARCARAAGALFLPQSRPPVSLGVFPCRLTLCLKVRFVP